MILTYSLSIILAKNKKIEEIFLENHENHQFCSAQQAPPWHLNRPISRLENIP